MAIPVSIIAALAGFAPQLVGWLTGSSKAEAVAEKAVEIAKAVTGADTAEQAIDAMKADPNLVLAYRKAVLDQALEFERLAVTNADAVNQTMRAESQSEHWPQYSWRPAIGFAVALAVLLSVLTVFMAYGAATFYGRAEGLQHLPGILAAVAGIIGVVSPILGIASWFRGKQKLADG